MVVRINISHAQERLSPGNIAKARYLAANQAMINMNQYVPYSGENDRNPHLRDTSYVDTDGTTITWNTPYARSQFYGVVNGHPVKNYTKTDDEKLKSKRWDLRMTSSKQDMNEVEKAFKGGLKG